MQTQNHHNHIHTQTKRPKLHENNVKFNQDFHQNPHIINKKNETPAGKYQITAFKNKGSNQKIKKTQITQKSKITNTINKISHKKMKFTNREEKRGERSTKTLLQLCD